MRFSIIIVFLFLPVITFGADNFYIDDNGWCRDFPIAFTIYNETEWNQREEIEDDEDINFSKLHFDIKIYDGPFTIGTPLYEKEYKDIILPTFNITFEEEKPYLIEIDAKKGNFTQYEEIFEVRYCPAIPKKEITYNTTLELNLDIVVEVKNSNLNNSNQIQIIKKDASIFSLPEEHEIFAFIAKKNSSGEFIVKIPINISKENHTVFILDENSNSLSEIKNSVISNNQIIFTTNSFNTYSLYQEEKITEEELLEIERKNQESISNQKEEEELEDFEKSSSALDFTNIVIVIIVILIIAIFAPKLFGAKTQKEAYHEEKLKEARQQISSSKEAYQKTKEYVTKYKNQYPRESIEKALKTSGVSEEIIQLVFGEEY